MRSGPLHTVVSFVVSLSVAWHCIIGCCGHHGHAHTDSDGDACGHSHVTVGDHSSCAHQCDSKPVGIAFAGVTASDVAEFFQNNSEASQCLGGKCAFVSGEKGPNVSVESDICHHFKSPLIDLWASVAPVVTKVIAPSRPPTLIGAVSARPQQLLCVWLI